MKRSSVGLLAVLCAVQLVDGKAFSAQHAVTATIQESLVEDVGGETFFRLTVNWPSQGVNDRFWDLQFDRALWPVDSLALLPQSSQALLVFREMSVGQGEVAISPWTSQNRLPSPVVFLGKTKSKGPVEFLLRCPNPEFKFSYLPLQVDFAKAGKGKELQKQWLRAEADFMATYSAPQDMSFFAFARAQIIKRLEKKAQGLPVSSSPSARAMGRDNLYEITTGALAMQESLQLDRLLNPVADKGARIHPVDKIPGVTVSSHPWDEMIGKANPQIEPIASLVPEENYYVRFRTVKSLKTFLDFAEQWGGLMLSQVELGGRDYKAREKLEEQICLKTSWLSNLLGEAVIESLALTGSDPYLREGADLSMIFRLKSETLFTAAVGRYLDEAKQNHADLKQEKSTYQGVAIEAYVTPDLAVRCHRASLGEYMVYSNNPLAIRKVIDTWAGKRPSLAKARDFVYMRTLYPLADSQEDGFVFLSDAFLRYLTGPTLRISEKRRLETVTSLEMIKNGTLFYLWEHPGAKIPTLDQLIAAKYLSREALWSEPGDALSFDPATFQASSRRYGRPGSLTPNLELGVDKVTDLEKQEYERFRTNYQDYWRRYFDPIGIRVTARDEVALSVTILPLIDHSEYLRSKEDIGGKSVDLEPLLRTGPVVLHFASHLNPESKDFKEIQTFTINLLPGTQKAAVEWLGERVEFWMEDCKELAQVLSEERFSTFMKIPMVFAVEVKNSMGLAAFLVAFRNMVETSAPGTVSFEPTERYRDHVFTRIRPASNDMRQDPEFKDLTILYGTVGNMLYVSNSWKALQKMVDQSVAQKQSPAGQAQGAAATFGAAQTAHMALRFNLQDAKFSKEFLKGFLGKQLLRSEIEHLRALWLLAHTVGLGQGALVAPERVLGYAIDSALGSSYQWDAQKDAVVSSQAGSLWGDFKIPDPWPDTAPVSKLLKSILSLRTTLEFTKEGLHTELSVRRTGK